MATAASISIKLWQNPPTSNEVRLQVTISGATSGQNTYLYPKINGNATSNFRSSVGTPSGTELALGTTYNGSLFITYTNCNLNEVNGYSINVVNGSGGPYTPSNTIFWEPISWRCYNLNTGELISSSSVSTSGTTEKDSMEAPVISGYTYQGYNYGYSFDNCLSTSIISGQYYCTGYTASRPYVAFFYTSNSTVDPDPTYYYYADYDITNSYYLSSIDSTTSTYRSTSGSYSNRIYKGYAIGNTLSNCISSGPNNSSNMYYDGSSPYVIFFYEYVQDYYYRCYDKTSGSWIDEIVNVNSSSIPAPDKTGQGYTYQGYYPGTNFDTIVNSGSYINSDTCYLSGNNDRVVFFYTQGWQNPNLVNTHRLGTSGATTSNIYASYCKAAYFEVYVPAKTAMIFETRLSSLGNYDPIGQIFTTNPANYGDTNNTGPWNAIRTLTPIDTDDDSAKSGNGNCQVSYVNNTSSQVLIYVTINPYTFQANDKSDLIPYKITATQNYYTINYYSNNGSTLLYSQNNYISDVSKINPANYTCLNNYQFLGWSKSANSKSWAVQNGATITISGNTNLYGVFQFKLSFDANGGSGSITPIEYYDNLNHIFILPGASSGIYKSLDYDDKIVRIPINRYNNNGDITLTDYCELDSGTSYSLKSWNTTNTGSGNTFNLNSSWNLTQMSLPNQGQNKLYAVWNSTSFTNKVRTPAKIRISPNEQYLEGYTFLGYTTNKDSTNVQYAINQEYDISVTAEINLYPVFKRKFYFGKNREWKDCKLYYGVNNEWKEIIVYKGIEGEWK